jgi:transcriptional regulator with XRE-family HTH domain
MGVIHLIMESRSKETTNEKKAKRIKEARHELGLSQERLGQAMGLSRNTISNIETGRADVTKDFCIFFCLLYSVNSAWLNKGEGEMFLDENQNLQEVIRIFDRLSLPMQECAVKQVKSLLELQRQQETQK